MTALDPLALIVSRLSSGLDTTILVVSDSLGEGYGDEQGRHGWVGRWGQKIAEHFDCTYIHHQWMLTDVTNIYSPLIWAAPETTVTGASGSPTLTIWNGSKGGTPIASHTQFLTVDWPALNMPFLTTMPDVVIHGSVANDYYASNLDQPGYVAAYTTFVNLLLTTFPGVPIMLHSQSPFGFWPFVENVNYLRQAWYNALGLAYPTTPTLLHPTLLFSDNPLVWFLDTLQALGLYSGPSGTFYSDGLHPNAAGYEIEAQWTYDQMDLPVAVAPSITTATLLPITQSVLFHQILEASGTPPIHWAVAPGSALPTWMTLDETSGLLSGTPTGGKTYKFTIQATNSMGSATQPYSGLINTRSLIPNGTVTSRVRLAGMWYPVTTKVKIAGEFHYVVGRATAVPIPVLKTPFTIPAKLGG